MGFEFGKPTSTGDHLGRVSDYNPLIPVPGSATLISGNEKGSLDHPREWNKVVCGVHPRESLG